ncbi:MAG: adenosylcobinamide-phosphate synthase CbiB [Planctomycetota bacterium]
MTILECNAIVLAFAVGIDLLFGEPHNCLHPVAWMGSAIGWLRRSCPSGNWFACLSWGMGITLIGVCVMFMLGIACEALLHWNLKEGAWVTSFMLSLLINAFVLKSCFGIRSLCKASESVDGALRVGNLEEARRLLAYHLVSRDVDRLDESEISAAAIESVAENTSDSVIAPVLFYLVAGIPGALAYRYINTCDAMLGYRKGNLEWLGKVPARADDLVNLLPSRITAGLMMLSSLPEIGRVSTGISVWWTDSGKTASPNAGHPMSVAAGLLGIRLGKAGHYVLGENLRAPCPRDISGMNRLFKRTVFLTGVFSSIAYVASARLSQ